MGNGDIMRSVGIQKGVIMGFIYPKNWPAAWWDWGHWGFRFCHISGIHPNQKHRMFGGMKKQPWMGKQGNMIGISCECNGNIMGIWWEFGGI